MRLARIEILQNEICKMEIVFISNNFIFVCIINRLIKNIFK